MDSVPVALTFLRTKKYPIFITSDCIEKCIKSISFQVVFCLIISVYIRCNFPNDAPFLIQDAIGEYEFDWLRLLQSDLGLTETNFRTLLYHRHEMQDGAFLEEMEKKPVQVLKGKFELDPVDLC